MDTTTYSEPNTLIIAERETGWLLDDGHLCLGRGSCGRLSWVTYTDTQAIRFARREDAENMCLALKSGNVQLAMMMERCTPVDHSWG